MMGLDTPETYRSWRNILRLCCASSWFFFTRIYRDARSTKHKICFVTLAMEWWTDAHARTHARTHAHIWEVCQINWRSCVAVLLGCAAPKVAHYVPSSHHYLQTLLSPSVKPSSRLAPSCTIVLPHMFEVCCEARYEKRLPGNLSVVIVRQVRW
jgi:hypothetical protein